LQSKGHSVIVSDIVSAGRRAAGGLAGWLASQDGAVRNARGASTEVSRRRVERDEVTIYLDRLAAAEASAESEEHWPDTSAHAAD
jgi:hypothetical protein